jgi:hypothetical protein
MEDGAKLLAKTDCYSTSQLEPNGTESIINRHCPELKERR